MSQRLKDALAVMQEQLPKQNASVTYLHRDGESEPYGALVTLEFLDRARKGKLTEPLPDKPGVSWAMEDVWDPWDHSHLEGDEDET
jgi:hypothetical protein